MKTVIYVRCTPLNSNVEPLTLPLPYKVRLYVVTLSTAGLVFGQTSSSSRMEAMDDCTKGPQCQDVFC